MKKAFNDLFSAKNLINELLQENRLAFAYLGKSRAFLTMKCLVGNKKWMNFAKMKVFVYDKKIHSLPEWWLSSQMGTSIRELTLSEVKDAELEGGNVESARGDNDDELDRCGGTFWEKLSANQKKIF